MDKFKTIGLGGLPLVLDDLRWFFGRLGSPNEGMYQAFNNLLRGFGDNFIVQGVVASGSSPNVAITEGWVILDGELIKVDAQIGINTTTNNKFVKVTTFDSRGNKTFQNATIEDTYEKNRAVIQGTSGNLAFNGTKIFKTEKKLADDSEVLVITNTKIIEIGDWDMDADSLKIVGAGTPFSIPFSLKKKIRSIDIMIRDDDGIFTSPLSRFKAGGTIEGGVQLIKDTEIELFRETGGFFDNTSYDSTSFNRGFITVVFEV